ncbi:unnamed protein product [Orchesella dallaii]|uniref:Uncharacterized protein n=1 Tax=Orchesella dallaii TaxID=48710 RepID=A0ABP1Q4T9_9HEXA
MCGIQESSSSSGYDSEEGFSFPLCEEENVFYDHAGKAGSISTEVEKLPLVMEECEAEEKGKESVEPAGAASSRTFDEKSENDSYEDDYDEDNATAEDSSSRPSTSCNNNNSSSIMPEYKQILQNLFSLFNNSKRKYPIPMYPYVKGQSSALIMSQSINTTSTNSNNNTGCSSH